MQKNIKVDFNSKIIALEIDYNKDYGNFFKNIVNELYLENKDYIKLKGYTRKINFQFGVDQEKQKRFLLLSYEQIDKIKSINLLMLSEAYRLINFIAEKIINRKDYYGFLDFIWIYNNDIYLWNKFRKIRST